MAAPGVPVVNNVASYLETPTYAVDNDWTAQPPFTLPMVYAGYDAPANIGDVGALAGYRVQLSKDINFLTGVITYATPTVVNSIFQYGILYANMSYFDNLSNDSVYYFRAQARNGNFKSGVYVQTWTENTSIGSYGGWCAPFRVRVGNPPPSQPYNTNAISYMPGVVLYSWNAPTDAGGGYNHGDAGTPGTAGYITGYQIQWSLSSTFASGVTTTDIAALTNKTFTGLPQGQTVYFRIRAQNERGTYSAWSANASVAVVAAATPQEARIDNPGPQGPVFFSLTGHCAGFDEKGNLVKAIETIRDYETRIHVPVTGSFVKLNNEIYAKDIIGDTLYFIDNPDNPSISSLNVTRFKTFLNAEDLSMSWTGLPKYSEYGGQQVDISIDYSAETITVESEYSVGTTRSTATNTVSLASLDLDSEIAVTVQYQRSVSSSFVYTHTLLVSVCSASNFAAPVHCQIQYATEDADNVTQKIKIYGNIRSLCTSNDYRTLAQSNVVDYELPVDYVADKTAPIMGAVPSSIKNVWDFLQESASASGYEIAVVNDQIISRKSGLNIIDITDVVGSPSITPTSSFSGKSIDIVYTNAELFTGGVMYNAINDNNRTFTAAAGETILNTVKSTGSPSVLEQPVNITVAQFINYVTAKEFPISCYGIIDSKGVAVVPAQWKEYGGSLSVKLNEEDPSSIDVTLVGPLEDIPTTTGPYTVGYSSGQSSYGALAIIGAGVIHNSQTLNLLTGAPEGRTPTDVASTVNNLFINNIEQAYNRGVWASANAAGPTVTLSGVIPSSHIQGFGLTAGSLIKYRNNIYRVTDANIGNLGVSFNAVVHVTVENFDQMWGDLEVGQHDALWGDSEVQDQIIFPFLEVGYPTLEGE